MFAINTKIHEVGMQQYVFQTVRSLDLSFWRYQVPGLILLPHRKCSESEGRFFVCFLQIITVNKIFFMYINRNDPKILNLDEK